MISIKLDKKTRNILLFIFIFFIVWICRVFLYKIFDENLPTPFLRTISSFLFKIIIWIIPVVLYLKFFENINCLKYLKLNTNLKSGFIWSVSIIIVGIVILIIILNLKIYQFTNPFQNQYSSVILIAPILEEITFRGFILNKLNEISSFWYVNIITSILFVAIHIPGWIIINETIILYDMIQLIISIFIISIILGWVMQKSGSLYPAIVLHAINNYFSILL